MPLHLLGLSEINTKSKGKRYQHYGEYESPIQQLDDNNAQDIAKKGKNKTPYAQVECNTKLRANKCIKQAY